VREDGGIGVCEGGVIAPSNPTQSSWMGKLVIRGSLWNVK